MLVDVEIPIAVDGISPRSKKLKTFLLKDTVTIDIPEIELMHVVEAFSIPRKVQRDEDEETTSYYKPQRPAVFDPGRTPFRFLGEHPDEVRKMAKAWSNRRVEIDLDF